MGSMLLAVAVILQVLLAGFGVFVDGRFWTWHAEVGASFIFVLPLLLVLAGWLGRVPVRARWLTAAVSGLVILQSVLIIPYRAGVTGPVRLAAGLHVVNALVIFYLAVRLAERAARLGREGSA